MASPLSPPPKELLNSLKDSLKPLNTIDGMAEIIRSLKNAKIHSYADVYIFIFVLVALEHPEIMRHPERQKLQDLWATCLKEASPRQLQTILNKPKNFWIKKSFDQQVSDYLATEPVAVAKPTRGMKK